MSRAWTPASDLTGGLTAEQQLADAIDRAQAEADAAYLMDRCLRVQRILRFHYDEWALIGVRCPWGKVADLLGQCMAHPSFALGEDWHDELQTFAQESGWPTIWICYAQAMSSQISEASRQS